MTMMEMSVVFIYINCMTHKINESFYSTAYTEKFTELCIL